MNIPFQTIDWPAVQSTQHPGEEGMATWQTREFNGLRLRLVKYSKGYKANHWCEKGHIVYCLEGEFTSELSTGDKFFLSKGMSYIVSDGLSSHRSVSASSVHLLIIDGDFLGAG